MLILYNYHFYLKSIFIWPLKGFNGLPQFTVNSGLNSEAYVFENSKSSIISGLKVKAKYLKI